MTLNDVVTNTGAVAAVASPIWLPTLHEASEFAALILPILGAVWLLIQIAFKFHAFHKGRHR